MREQSELSKDRQVVKKLLNYLYYLGIVFLVFTCQQNDKFPLDPFFQELEKKSPEDVIKRFKAAPLDSVVLNHKKYSAIFVDAAAAVLEDSTQIKLFEDFLDENEMTSEQDLYTIIAAFHKRLHNEKVQWNELREEMINLSNRHNEKKIWKT